jgi:hypothetical protein
VTGPDAPRLDPRRTADFAAELERRARAWIPSWDLANADGDFGRALLDIAARFSAEVAERLDGAGEKMRRGFLDWLAVRGTAARPARMPVVFKLTDAAPSAVLAEAPVRLQAAAGSASVVFETEEDVRIVPGRLDSVVGVDGDAFYLAPPGLSSLEPLDSSPTRWQPKRFTAAGATKLQLDPDGGLAEGTIIEAGRQQYRVTKVDKDLVTIEPPLDAELAESDVVSKVDSFTPFDATARNWQAHALYFGDTELLNIEAAATIEVVGATALQDGVTWQYYGKVAPGDDVGWQPLTLGTPQEQAAAKGLVLKKPKGSVEVVDVAGKSSRWIRASSAESSGRFTADQLTLRINAAQCDNPPCPADPSSPSVVAEAMANTTPLVLQTAFFPLGKEPRQFDAFYLGSQEAFSKPGAKVHLCFEMADPKVAALAALRGGSLLDNLVLAGVAADGYLYLLVVDGAGHLTRYGNPRRPPSPDGNGSPVASTPVALDRRPAFRPAMWADGSALAVAVSAGLTVWVWVENLLAPAHSGWTSLGVVDPTAASNAHVEGLVHLADGAKGRLFALLDKALFVRDLNDSNGQWQFVETKQGAADVSLQQIAPIASQANGLGGQLGEGLVGVDTNGTVFAVTLAGAPLAGACKKLLDNADPTVAPAAVRRADNRLVAVAVGQAGAPRQVLGFLSNPGALTQSALDDADLDWPDIVGNSIDANVTGGQLTFAFCVKDGDNRAVATWSPLFTPAKTPLYRVTIPSSVGVVDGAPTLLPSYVIAPTAASEVIVANYDPSRRTTFIAPPGAAIVTATGADRLLPGDSVAYHVAPATPKYHLEAIPDAGIAVGERRFHAFSTPADADDLLVYKSTLTPLVGSIATPANLKKLTIDAADGATGNGSVLLITTDANTKLYEVTAFNGGTGVATLDRDLEVTNPAAPPATVTYQTPDSSGAVVRPTLRLNATSNAWNPALLDRTPIYFEGSVPALQAGTVLPPDAPPPPTLVALERFWTTAPPVLPLGVKFTIDAALGDWTRQLGDTSTNPELSWEYWNGTGWWTLGSVQDDTRNLKTTGAVGFDVPPDLKPTDWSGKTNHWIRARLIGGDYGQEKITVVTTTSGSTSEQTVQRSTDGIRAPVVLHLQISYGLCTPVQPTYVLAADSGSVRDQSDANRTAGAIVEAFVPLPVLLGRLSEPAPVDPAQQDGCPPACGCGGQASQQAATLPPTTSAPTPPAAAAAGRQVLIGVSAALSEAPVNILLLVEERNHTTLAPMVVEALNGDRFEPLVVDDATRALGESGVLSMSFAIPPSPRELFGRTLTWLRLTPKRGAAGTWAPVIRGAYLNAVFASATETLTRELLGSSEGAPGLALRVARPPVLHDTLELRVREPLGDAEREQLRAADPRVVLSDVDGLAGDWVLWERVIDPADEAPGRRVYALDEAIGEVRFGDGLHGMIPPIGTDSIVAFSYKRTEPAAPGSDTVPANTIAARTPLNVVSPVESVESVIAADQAAGGAPPESDERVIRFGFARLRHRNRAVTASDLEDIALQSSPDIVQARCLASRTGLRLVIVMKGRKPSPTSAQVRELRRLLLDAAPASLGAPGALTIVGPAARSLRLDLTLRIERLDSAGEVARDVKARLAAFFDTATGGVDASGWPLGASPSDEDIAVALLDVPLLESIGTVTLREHVEGAADRPWPAALRPTEIVVLADDPVRIRFETAEVMA